MYGDFSTFVCLDIGEKTLVAFDEGSGLKGG